MLHGKAWVLFRALLTTPLDECEAFVLFAKVIMSTLLDCYNVSLSIVFPKIIWMIPREPT